MCGVHVGSGSHRIIDLRYIKLANGNNHKVYVGARSCWVSRTGGSLIMLLTKPLQLLISTVHGDASFSFVVMS